MSLSLVGIIFVQAYYINNSLKNEEDQFTFNVKKALSFTSKKIEDTEFKDYVLKFQDLLDQGVKPDTMAFRQLYLKEEGRGSNEKLIYRNSILEENYKLSSSIFDIGLDSINIKKVLSDRETKILKGNALESNSNLNLDAMMFEFGKLSKGVEIFYDTAYEDLSYRVPIHKRVSRAEINRLLKLKLLEDNIDIDFQFAIYSNDLATKIQSDDFELLTESTFSVPIFQNKNDISNYRLLVNFPKRNTFVQSSIIRMTLLSIIFTSIIIIAYASALMQLIKQRKISEIKTDFINNMTHEFKTPIATINLALDAIRNPKIIDDKEKVLRYLGMIKDENKRMHAQVENVLRISKLEKNELNISKERVIMHDLIEDALTHVELIVEDKNGEIHVDLAATNSMVLANETHFTNVIVNILDNAIKYTPESRAPIIHVSTENVGTNIIIKIKDQGSGMGKAAQKRVFEKFYREHTGDRHDVKGHGLGLAYVKRIVEDHQGHISVESEKDKGSLFIIKLPLIS
ncbi:HAMP domain-containing sensor histidine kinase [Xanthomarina sp. F1114]|uniref:sensor histidine kinase n=1 Tax=Xanthomarina sp. F1114 TaxID=2996019 RepID=UPI00225E5E54|nr:HAMP domain-containing sensor histidine kinase [Xanthomarina sp. F1114]MCX7547426.1 HAMP domain-containing sensor histidine kinase [Xanthomarina sp. F1114]